MLMCEEGEKKTPYWFQKEFFHLLDTTCNDAFVVLLGGRESKVGELKSSFHESQSWLGIDQIIMATS